MANIMEATGQSALKPDEGNASVLIDALEESKNLSVEDIIKIFADKGFDRPERSAKELVWELVEKGKVQFNDDWLLELT